MRQGAMVAKTSGDYEFTGKVLCVFETGAGKERVVVESVLIPGLVHIFSPTQLVVLSEPFG